MLSVLSASPLIYHMMGHVITHGSLRLDVGLG